MEVLMELLSSNTAIGRVDWLGLARASRSAIETPDQVSLVIGGVSGDHHCKPNKKSKRQVTLIQAEHLPVVAAFLRKDPIDPATLRRNVVVSGINLAALKYQKFRIGTAVLEGSGNCPPCSRMEENLGAGGYAAMVAHGGITAIVLKEGTVCAGDTVQAIFACEESL